jgi:hypothetical protein
LPVRDIDAAKAQGLKTILHKVNAKIYTESWRGYTTPQFAPDAAIESFSQLWDILE